MNTESRWIFTGLYGLNAVIIILMSAEHPGAMPWAYVLIGIVIGLWMGAPGKTKR